MVAIGTWAFVALFVVKYRLGWYGTNVKGGRCTHIGFSMVFVLAGSLVVFQNPNQPAHPLIGIGLILGFALVAVGNVID